MATKEINTPIVETKTQNGKVTPITSNGGNGDYTADSIKVLGGMEAVIWTDLVQFVIYVAGALTAAWFILRILPGGLGEYLQLNQSAGKFQLFDIDESPIKVRTLWAGLIGGAFVTMASHGADQNMVQRYLCARSLGSARAALTSAIRCCSCLGLARCCSSR